MTRTAFVTALVAGAVVLAGCHSNSKDYACPDGYLKKDNTCFATTAPLTTSPVKTVVPSTTSPSPIP